jgi:hypothetical protein
MRGEDAGSDMAQLNSAQIGAAGVLLVQYRLLKMGIDSAPMTTDAGIDLVAYSPRNQKAVTIQVKANLQPKAAGGKGAPALDWWLNEECPAEFIAIVNLGQDQVWLFDRVEFLRQAQQRSGGKVHFYFYVNDTFKARDNCHAHDYEANRLEIVAAKLIV